ncbi:hypothetical protein AG0111_0g12495 [Alternaria gaisen]|uniref:Uncharacterized protein n=1 Tax=Alternaria gaisen TaxID=167740 RepID=A0ACB6F4F4_9PLEO|nr:hypothetical protein AG0111_0g12495 [Alternaria gaisen]
MASAQRQRVEEKVYDILIAEDLIDHSTGIVPMRGLKSALSLKDRFARRLSKMLGAEVDIQQADNANAMAIYLTRSRSTARDVLQIACDDLWDVILIFNRTKIETIIQRLQKTLQDYQETFDDLVTRMFGIDDPEYKDQLLDRELGDRIISLSQRINSYERSMKELNALVHLASETTRVLLHLQERLRSLLEKTRFADRFYELICTLGFPERVHSTMVRSARASRAFENLTFHLRPSSPGKTVSFAIPTESSTQPNGKIPLSPQQQEKPKRRCYVENKITIPAVPPTLPFHHPQPAISSLGPLMTAVQVYLAREDKGLALVRLQPTTKQETTQLIGTILQGKLLPIHASAWYAFGFVTTKNEDEEQHLSGLYMALLSEADNSEVIFRELQTALKMEKNSLVTLFDKHGYGHFRQLFPYLETFLTIPPQQRSTVWRLRQFLKDPTDDEPPASLQRDYVFRYCRQREEVLRLKEIYIRMLRKIGPKNLHTACIDGRLFKTAVKEGVEIDPKDKRFLNNDYGSPFLGIDNEGGLEAYCGPFYRRKLKL